jgi:hypothetical protein
MPNGGSDNCGTCGFNSNNNGDWGLVIGREEEKLACCTIRKMTLPDPYYTYCRNWHSRSSHPEDPVYCPGLISPYIHLPYFNNVRPKIITLSGICELCGRKYQYDKAIQINTGDSILVFCSNEEYNSWWDDHHVA